jgi:hypothetical protein
MRGYLRNADEASTAMPPRHSSLGGRHIWSGAFEAAAIGAADIRATDGDGLSGGVPDCGTVLEPGSSNADSCTTGCAWLVCRPLILSARI